MKTTTGQRDGLHNVKLHTITWAPDRASKADVVLVHGYGEHASRYEYVAQKLTSKGFTIHTMDLRGHGDTTGLLRGEVDSFDDLVTDVENLVNDVRSDKPLFVYGHSMGGLASVRLAERRRVEIDGLIAQGSLIKSADAIPPILVKVVDVAARLAPTMRTIALDGTAISRDPEVVAAYDADPLNFRGKVTTRTGSQLNRAMHTANQEFARISVPILVLHGALDRLTDPVGSLHLASGVASEDVQLEIIPGGFHEIHNDPDRDRTIGIISDWLTAHTKLVLASRT